MGSDAREYVFGCGSLLRHRRSDARPVHVTGFRRAWNVGMDNHRDLPGYKYDVDRAGRRPNVFVTFLNLVAHAGGRVNGVVIPVTRAELGVLDRRERNYARCEVSRSVIGGPDGIVWTYLGTGGARTRYERARFGLRAVVSRGYYEAVRSGFATFGAEAADQFDASTDAPGCPIRELARIDLP